MDIVYKQAFSEALEVLKNTNKSILEKIPPQFITFLNNNKDDEYIVNIDFSKDNWEDSVMPETQGILALIYRDYIVPKEKRIELIKEEKEEQKRIENEIREKYNTDNIFKKEEKIVIKENKNLPAEIKRESFFKRVIARIKKIFNKTK